MILTEDEAKMKRRRSAMIIEPRFVARAIERSMVNDKAMVFDTTLGHSLLAVCSCHDLKTAEMIALALNREMMQ